MVTILITRFYFFYCQYLHDLNLDLNLNLGLNLNLNLTLNINANHYLVFLTNYSN